MGSGVKDLNRGGIRDHSPGIWDHNPWDRDQQCLHGIRDHSVLHNNKNPTKITKRAFQALSGIFKVLVLFSDFVFMVFTLPGFMTGHTGYGHAIRRLDSFTLHGA